MATLVVLQRGLRGAQEAGLTVMDASVRMMRRVGFSSCPLLRDICQMRNLGQSLIAA